MILTPCSGHFPAGKLVAIMGPSGCGKSTLLDILAGKKTSKYSGSVYLNGHPRDRLFPKVTSYVPQADVMHPHQTVIEAVRFNMRLARATPVNIKRDAAARAEVEKILCMNLDALGLSKVARTKIGSESVRGCNRRVTAV